MRAPGTNPCRSSCGRSSGRPSAVLNSDNRIDPSVAATSTPTTDTCPTVPGDAPDAGNSDARPTQRYAPFGAHTLARVIPLSSVPKSRARTVRSKAVVGSAKSSTAKPGRSDLTWKFVVGCAGVSRKLADSIITIKVSNERTAASLARAASENAVSSSVIGNVSCSRTAPPSTCDVMRCQVTPCSEQPSSSAHAVELNPPYEGSNESWKLIAPSRGNARTSAGVMAWLTMLNSRSKGSPDSAAARGSVGSTRATPLRCAHALATGQFDTSFATRCPRRSKTSAQAVNGVPWPMRTQSSGMAAGVDVEGEQRTMF